MCVLPHLLMGAGGYSLGEVVGESRPRAVVMQILSLQEQVGALSHLVPLLPFLQVRVHCGPCRLEFLLYIVSVAEVIIELLHQDLVMVGLEFLLVLFEGCVKQVGREEVLVEELL